MVTQGSTTATIPVATTFRGVPAAREAVEAARVAPAVQFSAAQPPPLVRQNFNEQVQAAIKGAVDRDVDMYRPRHWEYLDYDEYRRPSFFNPLDSEMTFRYFYDGEYRTVVVPAGGRVVLDAVMAGVFPYTAVVRDLISVGSFYGGSWVPPVDWVRPPPADWQPWQPVIYTGVPVKFANLGQSVLVDQVTVVGHDDSLPVGQRDVVMLNDATLARGDIQQNPDGGPPEVTVDQTQTLPGVGQWDDGHQYINTALEKPSPASNNHLPWVIGGLAAVLALLGGIVAWVWKHPRGDHAVANAPSELLNPDLPREWLSYDDARDPQPAINSDSPGVGQDETQLDHRPLTS